MARHRKTRYRDNPDWNNIVYSLLRLGDVSKNNQVGEVEAALDKAKALIEKFNLSHHMSMLNTLYAKLEKFKRGEKVDETAHQGQSSSSSSSNSQGSAWDEWWKRWHDAEYRRRQQRQQDRRRSRYERQYGAHEQTKKSRASGGTSGRSSRGRYKRSDKIEWLVKHNPKRRTSAAGKRWEAYYGAATVGEFLEKGGRMSDIKYNVAHHFMRVTPAT